MRLPQNPHAVMLSEINDGQAALMVDPGYFTALGVAPVLRLGIEAAYEQVGVAPDGGEQVAEVVGDAAGEAAGRLELARLAQLLLELGTSNPEIHRWQRHRSG